jgi:transcriptional regulator GlxA family with amidase domain
MQAAATMMTQELVMSSPTLSAATAEETRQWLRSAAKVTFLVIGIAATAWILGQYGMILVYGLPAPFLRRVPVAEAA